MAIKNGRKLELEKMVKESMVQCKLLGLDVTNAADLVKKAMKSKGSQLSKEEVQYCVGYQATLLAATPNGAGTPETTNLGGVDDATKIGKTPNVEGVPVGEAVEPEVVEAEIVEVTPYSLKKSLIVNTDKAQNKVSFELDLPTEEQVSDMVENSDRYIKGLAAVGSKVLKTALIETADDYLDNAFKSTSTIYKRTGSLSPRGEEIKRAFSNLASSVLSSFFK